MPLELSIVLHVEGCAVEWVFVKCFAYRRENHMATVTISRKFQVVPNLVQGTID